MTNKSTLAQRLSHAWPWTKPIGSSPTASRLLRYSLLCMLVLLCGGSAWAEDDPIETITLSEQGYKNGDEVSSTKGTAVTLTFDKGTSTNTPAYYDTGTGVRVYAGGKMTVSADGKTITKVIVTFGKDKSPTILINSNGTNTSAGTDSPATWIGSATEVYFNVTNKGHARIQSVEVTFHEDTRTATTLAFAEGYATTGTEGGTIDLPTATVMAGETAVTGAEVTWKSSDESVAKIEDNKISLLTPGTATITASYAGNGTYKSSKATYELTVTEVSVEGLASMAIIFKETGTSSDGSSKVSSIDDIISEGSDYVSAIPTATNVYNGRSKQGLKLGAKSNPGTLTLTLAQAVKPIKITFDAMQYSAGEASITVNGKTITNLGSELATYSIVYDGNTEVSEITISTPEKRAYITNVKIYYEGVVDNRTATTMAFAEGYTTSGTAGQAIDLPTATVMAGEASVEGATVTWTSSDESVATISGDVIKLLAAGTATIKAEYAGDDTYKNSEKSYTVTVTEAPITTAGALNDAAKDGGNDGKPVTYNFTNAKVVYVNGSYNYIADATGYALLYGSLELTAGKLITGTLTGTAKTYNGLPEIAVTVTNINVTSTTDDTETATPTTITVDKLGDNINNYIKIESATYVSADGQNLTFKVGETSFIVRNQFKLDVSALEANKVYNITGFGSEYTTSDSRTLQVYLTEIAEATPTIQYVYLWASVSSSTATAEEVATVSQALFDRDSGFPANYDAVSNSKELFTLDETTGKYTLSYTNVNVPADGMGISWTVLVNKNSLASSTFKWVDIDKAGLYDITFTYDPTATENQLTATATKKDFYILGVAGWELPADMKKMTWNAESQAYEYKFNNTETKYFCFSQTNEITENDWETFNSTYRWAYSEGGFTPEINTETQLNKVTGENDNIVLPAGEWTISVTADKVLTITGTPADTPAEDIYVVAGGYSDQPANEENPLFGTTWAGTLEANQMTLSNGVYTKTYNDVELTEGTIEYQIVKNGNSWIPGSNKWFDFGAGTYDITFTYDPNATEGDGITMTATLKYESVYAVGNGLGTLTEWSFADDNKLTESTETPGVYSITYNNVPASEAVFKFALDRKWDHNFGGTKDGDKAFSATIGTEYNAVYDGANISITTTETSNITLTLDLSNFDFTTKQGAKFTITSKPVEEPGGDDISGVFFSADVIATDKESFAANTTDKEITSEQATIKGGKLYATNGENSDKVLIGKQGNYYMLCLTNNSTRFKVELDHALAAGDIISAKTYSRTDSELGLWISTATSRPNTCTAELAIDAVQTAAYEDFSSYTVTAEDGLVGAKTIYIYRAVGKSTYFDEFTITRPAEEPVAEDVTAMWDFEHNCANLASKNDGGAYTETTMASNVEGVSMTIAYNGGQIKNNDNSYQVTNGVVMQIPVKNAGDEVTVVGYPGYYSYSIGGTDATEQTTTHKATADEAAQGYVAVASTSNDNYIKSIAVTQYAPKPVGLKEKAIIDTDFQDWTKSSTTTVVTTKYTKENITFTYSNATVDPDATNESKFPTTTDAAYKGYIMSDKKEATITTTTFASITKIRYRHGATGNDRGWGLKMKVGDGEWETVSDATVGSTPAWIEKTIDKENVQLKWYNLNTEQNAYMFELEVYAKVDLSNSPLLATLKANGTTYTAEDIFEMGTDDNYAATIELASSETMPSAENPVEAVADNGEIGDITYDASNDQSIVTIPVTAGEASVNYVATFVRKPKFTLTYYNLDGEEIGTQQVEKDAKIGEFAYNIADVQAKTDGYKARGWFKNNYVGEKWTTESVITADAKLYAVETEIEVSSDFKEYEYDLTDKNFDANDHEAFNPIGNGKYHNEHGWIFGNGDKIELLVGKKATISIGLCQYSVAGSTISASNKESIDAVVESCGNTGVIEYEGNAGTLTLTINSTGSVYIHNIDILNTTTTNYEVNGDWIIVKEDDASSLAAAIKAAKEGTRIFLPNGTYDLGQKTKTKIGKNNVSIIGESMEGVIIKNRPTAEGISTTATLLNTSTGLYMQDLTLQNDWDYYNGGADGRAVCIQDKGTQTICKNVTLLSYQDTYYTNNANGEYYWETSDIHGTVDFICGEGTLFMEESTLTVEKRKADGSGECTITAPSTAAGKEVGYVFNNCKIENSAASFNLGRAWNNEPRCAFINPTYNDARLIANRWTLNGMNVVAKEFVEYNPSDGKTENNVTFTYGNASNTMNTIISNADKFSIDKVFTGWAPNEIATQIEAPVAELKNGVITWEKVDGATAYALFNNGSLMAIVDGETTAYTIEGAESGQGAPALRRAEEPEKTGYTIRAANGRGGFGIAKGVTLATGIAAIEAELGGDVNIYDLNGRRVMTPTKGVYIINGKKVVIK